MSNNTEALTVDAIKSAMFSSLESYVFLVVDSIEFELSRKLTDEEQQRVHIFVSSSINESSKPDPCPRCGSRSSRPNSEHYCHRPRQEVSND